MSDGRAMRQAFRKIVHRGDGHRQGPVRARVVKQYRTGGLYHVDVQVLGPTGEPNPAWEVLRRLDAPHQFWAGPGTGVFVTLKEGTIVRVGFEELDIHRPYVETVLGSPDAPATSAEFQIISNGAVVTVSGGQVAIEAGTVKVMSGSWCHVEAGAWLEIYGEKVLLGADGANQRIIRGDDFITALVAKINTSTKFGGSPIDEPWTEAEFQEHLSAKVETV